MKIGNTIYLDHQATTPVDRQILEAMTPYFDSAFGNPHSADHVLGWSAAEAVEVSATKIGKLIGADANEIIFTSGATEANNLALLGLARRASGGKRGRILVSMIEHKSVLATAFAIQEQLGYEVETIPVDRNGVVMLADLKDSLKNEDVLLVSVMLVNNEIGTIQPIKEVSELCMRSGTILHCDGAQAPCAYYLPDITTYADLLSLSAHKMYGPKGVGALFVRHDLQRGIEPIIYGGGQQYDLRSGTVPAPLCVGMGMAAELLNAVEAQEEREQLRRRRERFIEGLRCLRWPIHLNGAPPANRHPGNANVRFDGFSAHDILGTLQPRLAASTGSACTTGTPEPSHVLKAIGLSECQAEASIRFSLGRLTTDQDVDESVGLIEEALSGLACTGVARSA